MIFDSRATSTCCYERVAMLLWRRTDFRLSYGLIHSARRSAPNGAAALLSIYTVSQK